MSLKTLALTGAGSYLAKVSNLAPLPDQGVAVAALRPRASVRVIDTIEVKADGTKDYTTIAAAITAAATLQTNTKAAEGSTITTPNHYVEILIHPGTYAISAQMSPPPFIAFIGASNTPGAVVLQAGDLGSSALGIFLTGGDFYMEGLDLVRAGPTPANSGKYCIHIGMGTYGTGTFARVRFYTATSHSVGGWTCVGMDGAPGIGLIFQECSLYEKSTGSYLPGGTNLHGLIGGAPAGSQTSDILFRACVAGHVGYKALTDVVADKVWADGGTYLSVDAEGLLTEVHYGNGATGTITSQGPIVANLTGQPTIAAGMTALERTHYFGTPA